MDADRIAPLLAKCGSAVACGLYFWLHSRTFGREGGIRISISWLAKELGASRSSVSDAIKTLEALGLVRYEGRRGNGGGSIFVVVGLTSLSNSESSVDKTLNDRRLCGNEADGGRLTAAPPDMSKKEEGYARVDSGTRFGIYDQ